MPAAATRETQATHMLKGVEDTLRTIAHAMTTHPNLVTPTGLEALADKLAWARAELTEINQVYRKGLEDVNAKCFYGDSVVDDLMHRRKLARQAIDNAAARNTEPDWDRITGPNGVL